MLQGSGVVVVWWCAGMVVVWCGVVVVVVWCGVVVCALFPEELDQEQSLIISA